MTTHMLARMIGDALPFFALAIPGDRIIDFTLSVKPGVISSSPWSLSGEGEAVSFPLPKKGEGESASRNEKEWSSIYLH